MTPGVYLRQCREAAGISLEAIALCIDTEPPVCVRRRVEWLETIEADVAEIEAGTALNLRMLFPFDRAVLCALIEEHGEVPASSGLRMAPCFSGYVDTAPSDQIARTAA